MIGRGSGMLRHSCTGCRTLAGRMAITYASLYVGGAPTPSAVAWAPPVPDRSRRHASELVDLKPNVILAQSALALARIERLTTIPIVFVQVVDPVGSGFVASLGRPRGNT